MMSQLFKERVIIGSQSLIVMGPILFVQSLWLDLRYPLSGKDRQ